MSEDPNPEAGGLPGVPGLGPSALSLALDRLQLVPLAIPPTQLRSGKHLGLQILPKSMPRPLDSAEILGEGGEGRGKEMMAAGPPSALGRSWGTSEA